MTRKAELIRIIDDLPDPVVDHLMDIIHYIKLGVQMEYVSQSSNEFYQSKEFSDMASESIRDYRAGKTEDMDILE